MSDRIIRCPFVPDTVKVYEEPISKTIWRSLEENGPKLAMVEVGTGLSVTFDQLNTRCSLVARRLLALGCKRGDVVAIFSPNSISWVVVQLAACRIGAVFAAINCLLTVDEIRYQLRLCQAKFVFTAKALADVALEAVKQLADFQEVLISDADHPGCVDIEKRPNHFEQLPSLPSFESMNIHPNDTVAILFSSGTTGPQKGVIVTHLNIQHGLGVARHPNCRLADSPATLAFAPLSHGTGITATALPLATGHTVHIMVRFDFEQFLRTLDENKIEYVLVVPPVATLMAKSPISRKYRLSSLKDIVVCAAPLSAEIEDQLIQAYPGLRVRQAYGLTESTGLVTFTPYEEDEKKLVRKPGTAGVPAPTVQIKIIDTKTGQSLGPRENGEICIKSPLVVPGYVGNPQATAESIDKDGWLHSGDIGYYDEDGYVFIVDRLKELIKYNAYQVAPSELEAVLLSHPEVDDAGVVGLPDPSAGELPLAWVVRKPNATVTELQLQQFVDGKVAPFKKLRGGVHFVPAIPKTVSGKILRREMKEAIRRAKL